MTGTIFLLALFVATIAYKLLLKRCSATLDHHTVPLFIGVWILIGLALTFPLFAPLAQQAWANGSVMPILFVLAAVKGVILYQTMVTGQKLMHVSLSSNLYAAPMAIGIIAIVNYALGERLNLSGWFSVLTMCALSCAFFFYGHLSELNRDAKRHYGLLIAFYVVLAGLDQYLIVRLNWYGLLVISNIALLTTAVAVDRTLKTGSIGGAIFNRLALPAGIVFAGAELFKFYQSVTINPITAVILVQSLATPVLLAISALIWKERTVKEQLIWGALAVVLALPLFF